MADSAARLTVRREDGTLFTVTEMLSWLAIEELKDLVGKAKVTHQTRISDGFDHVFVQKGTLIRVDELRDFKAVR